MKPNAPLQQPDQTISKDLSGEPIIIHPTTIDNIFFYLFKTIKELFFQRMTPQKISIKQINCPNNYYKNRSRNRRKKKIKKRHNDSFLIQKTNTNSVSNVFIEVIDHIMLFNFDICGLFLCNFKIIYSVGNIDKPTSQLTWLLQRIWYIMPPTPNG